MEQGHDLTDLRASGDAAIRDIIKLRAKLDETKRELRAVTMDRDDVLKEYSSLRQTKHQPPSIPKKPAGYKKRDGLVRIIANDVHGASMDRAAVDAFIRDLRQWDADEVVLNGDILECGGFLAQHHTLGYVAQSKYTFQEDVAAANWFLDEVQRAAPRATIHFIFGNHDTRIEKWIVDQTLRNTRDSAFLYELLSPEVLLKFKERGVKSWALDTCHVPGLPNGWIKLGKVFFTHQLSGSKNAARDSVGRTAGNIVIAHTHRVDSATIVLPGVGLVSAWNPGCLCEMQPMWRHSDPTSWSHGYAVQLVSKNEEFLHLNIPIWQGKSLLGDLMSRIKS